MSLEDSELDPDADKDSASEETEDETVAYGETDEWGSNDLEAAYRKALEANDNVEWEFNHLDPAEESTEYDDSPEESPNDAVADDVGSSNRRRFRTSIPAQQQPKSNSPASHRSAGNRSGNFCWRRTTDVQENSATC